MVNWQRLVGQLVLAEFLLAALANTAHAEQPQLWGKLPLGPHAVGFKTGWQFDYSRRYNMEFDDKSTYATGKAPRPILINMWYPASRRADARHMPHREYFNIQAADPQLAKFAVKLADYNRVTLTKEMLSKLAKDAADKEKTLLDKFLDTPTACVRDATVVEGKFPLVIYHSGYGSSFEDNSVMCEFLASHGYVVMGSAYQEPSGASFNIDGKQTSARDIEFLIAHARQIPGVDWQHIGVIGHSGGAHAALMYRAQPNSAVDAVVSLDTTQDYYGLQNPGWDEMKSQVLKGGKDFRCALLMAAGAHAFFELADTLRFAERYYFTLKNHDHNDYISQGVLSKLQLKLSDQIKSADDRAKQKAEVDKASAGYEALCGYVLRFLDAQLKGDKAGKEFLGKQYRDTKLGGVEPHVEHMPVGQTGPEPYKVENTSPPTPRQLRRFVREHGSAPTIALLKRFRKELPKLPIYMQNFELNLVSDLLDEGKTEVASAFHDYYCECGLDCAKIFLSFGKSFEGYGITKTATEYYKRVLLLEPKNQDAADRLNALSELKKDSGK